MTVVSALAYAALRPRIDRWARSIVYRDARGSSDLVRTFAARMTRSVPLDELALQTAEQLRDRFGLAAAELWILQGAELRPWIGDRYVALGTDGFGRSDTRAALRAFFEVDRRSIALAALHAVDPALAERARGAWGLSAGTPPWAR